MIRDIFSLKNKIFDSGEFFKRFSGVIFHPNNCFFIFFILIAILFSVYVNNTPLYTDDYLYKFNDSENVLKNHYHKIPIISYYTDNFAKVSRFVPHLIIGLFQNIGKWFYDILSGFFFILYGFITSRVITERKSQLLPLTFISCGIIFFLVKGFFQIAIWMSGAPNYLYPAIMVSVFLILLRGNKQIIRIPLLNYIILFLYGFITGWTSEGFIVGLTGACIIYYGLFRRKEIDRKGFVLLAGLFFGCCFLCLTPFNISRFLGTGPSHVNNSTELIRNILLYLMRMKTVLITMFLFVSLLVVYAVFYLIDKKGKVISFLNNWIKENLIIIIALILSWLFWVVTFTNSYRSRFPTEFFTILLLLSLISNLRIKVVKVLGGLSGIALIVVLVIIIPFAKSNAEIYRDIEAQIRQNKPVIIVPHITYPEWQKRYIVPAYLSLYPFTILNSYEITNYYANKDNPYIIDEEIYNFINDNPAPWKSFHRDEWKARYICLEDNKDIVKVKLNIMKTDFDDIKIPLDKFYNSEEKRRFIEHKIKKSKIIQIGDRKWLLIPDYDLLNKKISSIELTVKPVEINSRPEQYQLSNHLNIIERD